MPLSKVKMVHLLVICSIAIFLVVAKNYFSEGKDQCDKGDQCSTDKLSDEIVYRNAKAYWKGVEASVNGVLSGYGNLSGVDVDDSISFLGKVMKKLNISRHSFALDCGAGIGRVSKHVLLPIFNQVDLVDVTQSFLDASASYIGPDLNKKVGKRICSGLQDFAPENGRYSLIWMQWVASQLTDDDLVKFFRRSRKALKLIKASDSDAMEGGAIVLKENVASRDKGNFDGEDHSWTRSYKELKNIFQRAGLRIVEEQVQSNFPKDLYQVKMIAVL